MVKRIHELTIGALLMLGLVSALGFVLSPPPARALGDELTRIARSLESIARSTEQLARVQGRCK